MNCRVSCIRNDILIGQFEDGSFFEERRLVVGCCDCYFLLLLGLDAEDIPVVEVVSEGRDIGLRCVVFDSYVLQLFL